MRHLELAISAAIAAVVVLGNASCSSTPPQPYGAKTRGAAVGNGVRAPCIPDAVAQRKAAMAGTVDPKQPLKVALQLPLRNQPELTQLLHDLYDSSSPRFHKYLSVSEFTARFGPTAEDYKKVVRWAKSEGLNVTTTTANRRLVGVEGSVQKINRAFKVQMSNYQHPLEGRVFYSADREPNPAGLSVPLLQITGLSNYVLPRPMHRRGKAAGLTGPGSGPSGEYLPSDMRAAYYGKGPLTGAGQTIGILSFDGYLPSDVRLYFSKTGTASKVPIKNVLVNGFSGGCSTPGSTPNSACDDGEQVLDIVNAIGMAPGIKEVLFYEGASDTQILNQMAVDNTAKVLSSSWGWNPSDAASDDPIFQEFAAQGQTFVSASGDSGQFNTETFFFPATDPYVLQVGGTDLMTTGPGGAWSGETAWAQSGGGNSSDTAIPPWQQLPGVVNSANMGSTTLRNSPDVAAEANFDNPTVVNGELVTGFGGTSFAAPRWAGLIALANQQSVANGRGTVGFINPTLYNLGTGGSRSMVFHDITSGSNPPTVGDGTGFNAVPGYDLVTGWGSPVGAALIDQLAGHKGK
jgi:subtilase family serine protease